MPKPSISEIARKAFLFDLERLWLEEYLCEETHCGLCGNSGVVDTVGIVVTPTGKSCGIRAFCLCPNGRTLKDQRADLARRPNGRYDSI